MHDFPKHSAHVLNKNIQSLASIRHCPYCQHLIKTPTFMKSQVFFLVSFCSAAGCREMQRDGGRLRFSPHPGVRPRPPDGLPLHSPTPPPRIFAVGLDPLPGIPARCVPHDSTENGQNSGRQQIGGGGIEAGDAGSFAEISEGGRGVAQKGPPGAADGGVRCADVNAGEGYEISCHQLRRKLALVGDWCAQVWVMQTNEPRLHSPSESSSMSCCYLP